MFSRQEKAYKLEFLTPEGMKDVHKDKDRKNVAKLEPVEAVLVHCNFVKIDHQDTLVTKNYIRNSTYQDLFIHYDVSTASCSHCQILS